MNFFLFLILIMIFFALFSVQRGKDGTIKVKSRYSNLPKTKSKKQGVSSLFKAIKSKSFLLSFLTTIFVISQLIIFLRLISPIQTLVTVRASQLIPDKFHPIARFAANMNWESKTISLDASMSKAYEDNITNYIWRIDDGTSLVGVKSLEHSFKDPGYYYIQLSIVDGDNQSDVATCQILVPPTEVEKVPTSERLTESAGVSSKTTSIQYDWAPVGTFFNYTKMASNQRSYANLKSQYIESGCGYSNKSYNTTSSNYVDFFHDNRVQRAMASMLRTALIGVVAIPSVYVFLMFVIKKKMSA